MVSKEAVEYQPIISLRVSRYNFNGDIHLEVYCPEVNMGVGIPQSKGRGSNITQDLLSEIWDNAEEIADDVNLDGYQEATYIETWRAIAQAKREGRTLRSIIKPKNRPQDTSCI